MHGFSGTVEQSCVKVTVIRTCKTVNLKQQVALGHHQKYCHCNKKLVRRLLYFGVIRQV